MKMVSSCGCNCSCMMAYCGNKNQDIKPKAVTKAQLLQYNL